MKEQVEHRARRPRLARDRIRLLDLRENLPLAQNERVKARRHAEEMRHSLLVRIGIEVFVKILPALRQVVQKLAQCLRTAFVILHGGVKLRSIACRERNPLAHLHRRRSMIEP